MTRKEWHRDLIPGSLPPRSTYLALLWKPSLKLDSLLVLRDRTHPKAMPGKVAAMARHGA